MLKVKLLTLHDRTAPESDNNKLEVRVVEIDQTQVSCSVWGNEYSTIHACALVDGQVKQVRAVVKHERNDPHLINPIKLTTVYWNCCEEIGDLVKYTVQDTIGSL